MPFSKAVDASINSQPYVIKYTEPKLAAPSGAGYSPSTTTTSLAVAWVDYCLHPEQEKTREKLACELEEALLLALPTGRNTGIMTGTEDEIRQESNLLLLGRYLAGNDDLIQATKKADLPATKKQIRKSLNGAIRATSRTLLRSLQKDRKKHHYCESIEDHPLAICKHPAERRTLWELPYEAQRELVFATLRMAIVEKRLAEQNVQLLVTMVKESLSQTDIAQARGVTRQAINQRIAPVREYLRTRIANQEFPLE